MMLASATMLTRFSAEQTKKSRYQSIDGLRGYLAFFVFLHHAMIWFSFVKTGRWETPSSNFFSHLGETSVSFFFMITGFLFYGKLLDSRKRDTDWVRFFVARFLRLAPLYFMAVLILMGLAFIKSQGVRLDSIPYIMKCIAEWCSFTIFGGPSVNRVDVSLILAKVNWSLPYEWYFYLCMPLLALTVGKTSQLQYIFLGISTLALAAHQEASPHFVGVFFSGICAAVILRFAWFQRLAVTPLSSFLVLTCLLILLNFFRSAYGPLQIILIGIAFSLIAGGADLFGVLSARLSHALGEVSYSIYLLHGIILFVTFELVFGIDAVREMSALLYWSIVAGLVPVLIFVSSATFRYVEYPAMQLTPKVMIWLHKRTKQILIIIKARPG
jgi:peptidoglycan/LPS O-acetylase OafA/YrhL